MKRSRSINDLLAEAQEVFGHIKESKELYGEEDNSFLAILTQPAVEILGSLSLKIQNTILDSDALRIEVQDTAQRLADFLESQGHANILKESESVRLISIYFPTFRKPKMFQPRLEA